MVVGRKTFSIEDVLANAKTVNTLKTFARSLIPDFAAHIPNILENQIYLVALAVRRIDMIPLKERTALCEELLDGIVVKGQINEVYDLQDILSRVNADKLKAEINARRARNYSIEDY